MLNKLNMFDVISFFETLSHQIIRIFHSITSLRAMDTVIMVYFKIPQTNFVY